MRAGGDPLPQIFFSKQSLIWNSYLESDQNYREILSKEHNLEIRRTKYPFTGLKWNLKKCFLSSQLPLIYHPFLFWLSSLPASFNISSHAVGLTCEEYVQKAVQIKMGDIEGLKKWRKNIIQRIKHCIILIDKVLIPAFGHGII